MGYYRFSYLRRAGPAGIPDLAVFLSRTAQSNDPLFDLVKALGTEFAIAFAALLTYLDEPRLG